MSVKPTDSSPQTSCFTCSYETSGKITAFVVGLLIAGGAVAMYFYHLNAYATGALGGSGATILIGAALWSVTNCLWENRGSREISWDLKHMENHVRVKQEEVTKLLQDNPKIQKLVVDIKNPRTGYSSYSLPDFSPLESQFSSKEVNTPYGLRYVFERKSQSAP